MFLGGIAVYLQTRPPQQTCYHWLGPTSAVLMLAVAGYDLTTYIHGGAQAG